MQFGMHIFYEMNGCNSSCTLVLFVTFVLLICKIIIYNIFVNIDRIIVDIPGGANLTQGNFMCFLLHIMLKE